MANKLFTIEERPQDAQLELMEVYVDLDTVSKTAPDFNVRVKPDTVGNYVNTLSSFMSSFVLSGYQIGEYGELTEAELPNIGTGWQWLTSYPYKAMAGQLSSPFTPDSASDVADMVFGYVSCEPPGSKIGLVPNDDGEVFTKQTLDMLSSSLHDAAQVKATAMSADMHRWLYKVSSLVNVNAVKNSVKQIFTWIPGERIINPEFGSNLRRYLYEPITEQNQERIVAEIQQCVLKWEPRVIIDRVVKVTQTDDIENNTVNLDIHYRIKGLDDLQFVYQYEYNRQKYNFI